MHNNEWERIESKLKEEFDNNIELSYFGITKEVPRVSGSKFNHKGEAYCTYDDRDYDFDAHLVMEAYIRNVRDANEKIIKCLDELGYEIESVAKSAYNAHKIRITFKRTSELNENRFIKFFGEDN